MRYRDLPVFQPVDDSISLPIRAELENSTDEVNRVNKWKKHEKELFARLQFRLKPKGYVEMISSILDEIDGIGMMQPINFTEYLYLDEQIQLFTHETNKRPNNPRNWKMLGFAHFSKAYIEPTHYSKAILSYSKCIVAIANHPLGYAYGLTAAKIGCQTPNRLRFEIGLSFGKCGYIEEAIYHLRLSGYDGFLDQYESSNYQTAITDEVEEYIRQHAGKKYCLDY